MNPYPRDDYTTLGRYLPDRSPVAVDLSDNRNLWGSHPDALDVLRSTESDLVSRYPGAYGDRLIEALATTHRISPENVATGAGGTGVLDTVMRAHASTTMRFLDPGWPAASMLARMNGHRPVPIDWSVGLSDPDHFVGDEPAIVFVANPNNPTGQAIPDDWVAAVHERAEAIGSVLILDEAYGEFSREAGQEPSRDLALAGERTLWVKTLSKAYGLAGLRIGYAVGAAALILEVDKARGPFTLTSLSAAAGAAALTSDSPWLTETLREAKEHRTRLLESLRHRGFAMPESRTNFVFVPIGRDHVEDTAQALLRVGVRARTFAGSTEQGTGLRATVGPWELMQRLIDGLDLVAGGQLRREAGRAS